MLIIGSKTSTTAELLKYIDPKYAVIGVGKDNKFGHPADSVLSDLKNLNCKIYRTDLDGEISIKTNGKKLNIKAFNENYE